MGQNKTIPLVNGSFEDVPRSSAKNINGWYDCGNINFPDESPPDIHPGQFWDNNLPASEGNTYLGMVVRDNGTYESVSQRLDGMLEAEKCYEFTIHISRAPKYVSLSHQTNTLTNYTTPVVLRIWGGLGFCHERELLAESDPVSNDSWQIFKFTFQPNTNVRSLTFQAYYKTPVLIPYNGNILIDGASDITIKPCPGQIAATAKTKSNLPPHKRNKTNTANNTPSQSPKDTPTVAVVQNSNKPKIMTELNRSSLKEGQVIEIKKLEFSADTSTINRSSYEVLDEVYQFLVTNSDVVVEIGGHTNNVPSDAYCDRLSSARAKVVAEYLVNRGIKSDKIQFKGYGKRKPVADNRTALGRQKNQRVEIKILSIS